MPGSGCYKALMKAILVTGAAGRVGSVGRTVTELLLARGVRVRAQVRADDDRAAKLRALGADVVVGDMLDLTAMHAAMADCGTVCFGMSVDSTYLEAVTNVAAVAKHHEVEAFINLSQMTVASMDITHTTSSPQQKQHWLAEQVLSWSGLPVVEVRPTAFMEGLFLQVARTIAMRNAIYVPFGTGKLSPIAARDVARVIADIAAAPARHVGRTYHLTGSTSQDMNTIAGEISAALGRDIAYVDVPLDTWKQQLAALSMSPHLVAHLVTMAQLYRDNAYDRLTDDVERLTGQPPMSIRDFIRIHAKAFEPSSGAR